MSVPPAQETAARPLRRRRPFLWIAPVGALAVLIALVAPWTVSRGALREEIAAQLRSSAGLYVFPRGPARISFLPRPRVRLDDVALVDPNGALIIEAASLTGDIRFLPLLAGRLEVAEVALASPRMMIDVDRAPLSTAGAVVRAASAPSASPQADKTDSARLGVVSIADGTVTLRRGGAAIASAEHVNARLDWRTIASPAAITAELDWRGRRQEFVLWISQPASLLRGGASPLTFEVRSRETTLTTAGTANVAVKPRYEGRLQVSTTSTPDLFSLLRLGISTPSVLNSATLNGDLVATPNSATVSNLRLNAGEEMFEGTLALQAMPEARPLLSGTLATPALSLAPYLAETMPLTGTDGRYNAEPFNLAARGGPDLDVRLSAARLRYERLQASDAALSILAKGDRIELSIVDAAAYGGVVKARTVLAAGEAPGRSDFQATLMMRDVNWGALDRDLSGQGRLNGTADVSASVQASGNSALEMAHSLTGQGRVAFAKGELGGLDVGGTLTRLEKRPLAAATDLGSGRTRFDRAILPFEINGGVATITTGEIVAPDFSMALAGSVQIYDGQATMTANVRSTTADADAANATGFTFDVAGPWNRPNFVPDVPGLIRRSGAASPLFPNPAPAGRVD